MSECQNNAGGTQKSHLLLTLCAATLAFVAPANAQYGWHSFDVSGAKSTYPAGIDNTNTIVGYWADSSGIFHGFLRAPGGSITTFDVPGAYFTAPEYISNGEFVGVWSDSNFFIHGFFGSADNTGDIKTFDVPGATNTYPSQINAQNRIVGSWTDQSKRSHGFEMRNLRVISTFDYPKAAGTYPEAINDKNAIAGVYLDRGAHGFVRSKGKFTGFDVARHASEMYVGGINSRGVIAGYYQESGLYHSFVRDSDGSITKLDLGNGAWTEATSINSSGEIVGFFYDGTSYHGFLRLADGQVITLDYPWDNVWTSPAGINKVEAVTGNYEDDAGKIHGFLRELIAGQRKAEAAGK